MSRGFTLIELLVASTIVLLLSGTAIVSFAGYRESRVVQEDAVAVAERLRTAQTKASAIEVPAVCASVTNYVMTLSGTSLSAVATCPGVGAVALPSLAFTLANSSFASPVTVTFDGRTISASTADICISGSNSIYKISVNEAANVSKPVRVATCP